MISNALLQPFLSLEVRVLMGVKGAGYAQRVTLCNLRHAMHQ